MTSTDPVLDELLATEGLADDGLDDLVAWATERAAQLAAEAVDDPELGPLLSGHIDEREKRPPVSTSDAATEPRAPVGAVDSARDDSELDLADRRILRDLDAPELPVRTGQTQPNAVVPVGAAAQEAAAGEAASQPTQDVEELDDVELLDDDELELVEDDEESAEGSVAAPPPPAPPPHREQTQPAAANPTSSPSYGPPDGSENVPEWKAALYSAELGDDHAARARIKEESHVGPAPRDPNLDAQPEPSQRLVAEEDEISQHNIDLSDLDGESDGTTTA